MLSDNEIRKANQRLVRLARQGLNYTSEYRRIERAARNQGNSQIFFNKEGVVQFRRTKDLNKRNAALVTDINESSIFNVKAVKQRNKLIEQKVKQTFEERHKDYNVENFSMRDLFDAIDEFDVYSYDNVVDAIKYYEDKGVSNERAQQLIENNIDRFVNRYGEDVAQHILRNTDALTKVMKGIKLNKDDFKTKQEQATYDGWVKSKGEEPW